MVEPASMESASVRMTSMVTSVKIIVRIYLFIFLKLENESSGVAWIVLLVILLLAGGAAAYYFLILNKKVRFLKILFKIIFFYI
jgi:hypothetical protein